MLSRAVSDKISPTSSPNLEKHATSESTRVNRLNFWKKEAGNRLSVPHFCLKTNYLFTALIQIKARLTRNLCPNSQPRTQRTSTPDSMAPAIAPWRALFLASLEKSKSSSFSLASIAHTTANKPVARSRTVEFRGFFPKPASTLHQSGIEALKTQGIGLNPDVYESDLFSITTDARMKKMGQIADSDDVEGVFWLEEVSTQWRVRGKAIAIGNPENGAGEKEARETVRKALRVKQEGEGDVKDWDWDRQVATYFANHSPVMRGLASSFLLMDIVANG